MASSLVTYLLHYAIARTLYDEIFRNNHFGVPGYVIIGVALLLLSLTGRHGKRTYERRMERPGRTYRRQRAIEEAKRDVRESTKTRGRWRF